MSDKTEFIDDLIDDVGDVLEVRDDIGVLRTNVYIVTRTWTGPALGEGRASESKIQVLPTPWVVEIGHDLRLLNNGAVQQGDILIKQISKKIYTKETDVDCTVTDERVQKFWEIDDKLYVVVNIKNQYATWEVLVRKTSDQTRY